VSRPDPDELRWGVTLGVGAVVVVTVAGLLEALRRSVADVDAAVDRVWTAGKLVAQNTQAAHQLEGTAARAAALRHQLGSPDGAGKERAS
jgi:hypothetical protein